MQFFYLPIVQRYDNIENICDSVDGAYQELNEALDEMEELLW